MKPRLTSERPTVDWSQAPAWAEIWGYDKGAAWWYAQGTPYDITTIADAAHGVQRSATAYNDRKEPAPLFGWTGPTRAEPRPAKA